MDALKNLELEEGPFMALMEKVIGCAEKVQNHPPEKIPQETLVARHVEEFLAPYSKANGGVLDIRLVEYVEGRANVIIKYQGTHPTKVVSFVGSHMDVVPANPEEWDVDPFSLTRDGDKISGRGVTDCLGHVVLVSNLFKALATLKPVLESSVVAIFIANEEASEEPGVGIDELQKRGELDPLQHGPLFWIDSADFGPTLGTAGMFGWQLTVTGKKFHSGLPHKSVNPIELCNEVVRYLQDRFYADFTEFADTEKKYLFPVSSSMKPTQVATPAGSINQIPGQCVCKGDIRFTPFYSAQQVREKVEGYMAELDVSTLPVRGYSRYEIKDCKGTAELKWLGDPFSGVAVNLESPGYKALHDSIAEVCGAAKPFSLTGSLPIIRDLFDAGFDVQITGFGRMDAYHANNEYALISDYAKGLRILGNIIHRLN